MINGDPKEFIEGLYYGDERFFLYKGKTYFIQGMGDGKKNTLSVYILYTHNDDFMWEVTSNEKRYYVECFEHAKIFDGKSFWEVQDEIEWVDC